MHYPSHPSAPKSSASMSGTASYNQSTKKVGDCGRRLREEHVEHEGRSFFCTNGKLAVQQILAHTLHCLDTKRPTGLHNPWPWRRTWSPFPFFQGRLCGPTQRAGHLRIRKPYIHRLYNIFPTIIFTKRAHTHNMSSYTQQMPGS